MKKLIVAVILVCFVCSMSFALELSQKSKLEIQNLTQYTEGMSQSEALLLSSQSQKNPWGPFALNFLVGFGIGSFVQDDTAGGVTAVVGDVVGLGVLLLAAKNYNVSTTSTGLLTGAYIALLGVRVFESIRPFMYSNEYNKQLTYSIQATIRPANDGDGVVPGVVGKVSF